MAKMGSECDDKEEGYTELTSIVVAAVINGWFTRAFISIFQKYHVLYWNPEAAGLAGAVNFAGRKLVLICMGIICEPLLHFCVCVCHYLRHSHCSFGMRAQGLLGPNPFTDSQIGLEVLDDIIMFIINASSAAKENDYLSRYVQMRYQIRDTFIKISYNG